MNKDMKLFRALNDIDNHLLMDESEDVKTFYVRYFKYVAASITLIVVIFGGYKLFKKENDTSASQGDSNPTSDYQTDVKVLHPGDKEPEDVNETFVYQVTAEEEEKMKQAGEEAIRQELENRENNSGISLSEYQDTMDKHTDVWTQMMNEAREMLVRFNGEDVVKKVEDEREESLKTENVDAITGVTEGTVKMWKLWLNTIYEHDDEITDSERAVLLTMISPLSLKNYVEKHPEYSDVYETWEKLKEKYPFPDEAIAERMSE